MIKKEYKSKRDEIRAEYLPYALAIGISEELFWSLNPRRLKPYIKAEQIRMEKSNRMLYYQGIYVRDALLSTVGNMFSKGKPMEYPSEPYRITPRSEEEEEQEKIRQTKELFARLKVMQDNFEISKKSKGGEE